MKRYLIAGLVRLYPSRWRAEYGGELSGILAARPLIIREVLNVALNAIWQQLRLQEPWLLIGVPLFVWTLIYFGASAVGVPVRAAATSSVPSTMIFIGVGLWTYLRDGRGAGRAAVKLNLLVCSPFVVVGVLTAIHALRVVVGAEPNGWGAWRPTLTFIDVGGKISPSDLTFLLIAGPILQIPIAGTLGWFGGLLSRVGMGRRGACPTVRP